MKRLVLAASLALALGACSETRQYVTDYPSTEQTMARIEAGAGKIGCEYEKVAIFGWAAGMLQAEVTCPDGREIAIKADGREYGDAILDKNTQPHTTSYDCDGTIEDDEAGCKKFMTDLWDAGAVAAN